MGDATAVDGFERTVFSAGGTEREVFRAGSGPAVVVMAEMPGITPRVADFARRVVERDLSVWMPVLFGQTGREPGAVAYARSIVPGCVSREFAAFATGRTAPVTRWLRSLASEAHEVSGGPGVGAVGMCFTGGFALGMMVDDRMLAPVLSQPSLPIALPGRSAARGDLHLAPEDLARVKARAAAGTEVLGLRFTCDRLVPDERFAALRAELGDAFIGVEIDSSPSNPWGLPRTAHSVLTEELVDEPGHPTHDALVQVLDFLAERLHT
jgi:dienelactone hydrolase